MGMSIILCEGKTDQSLLGNYPKIEKNRLIHSVS